MNKTIPTRLSPITQDEIKKYKAFPTESYDSVLQRLFGLRRPPKQFLFKLKGGKNKDATKR